MQIVLLFEFFQPCWTVKIDGTFGPIATGHPKKPCLALDEFVGNLNALALLICDPFAKRPINVWVLALGFPQRRPTSVCLLLEVLLFMAENLRDGAVDYSVRCSHEK